MRGKGREKREACAGEKSGYIRRGKSDRKKLECGRSKNNIIKRQVKSESKR